MVDWITGVMASLGYVGIALLMFLENLFPPIPSEVVIPLAGFTAARGPLSLPGVIAAALLGSVAGALPWYWLGRALGTERLAWLADRYGRYLALSGRDVWRADRWFDRHGPKVVLFGRMVPAIRTLISVPAGVSEMPFVPFLIYTTLGSLAWTTLLAVAGYLLEANWERVAAIIDPVSKAVVVAVVAAVALFLARQVLRARRRPGG